MYRHWHSSLRLTSTNKYSGLGKTLLRHGVVLSPQNLPSWPLVRHRLAGPVATTALTSTPEGSSAALDLQTHHLFSAARVRILLLSRDLEAHVLVSTAPSFCG